MTNDAERHPVERLAAEFVERLRQPGAAPAPAPEGELGEFVPTLKLLEAARRRVGPPSGVAGMKLERLGDLRIVREIGRGGMGVVFEAEQESLRRRVAVKVLPRAALFDERQLLRFRRETQTAAGLHHTNIVPVLGAGEQDGFHYYVMQLIDGRGLDAWLRSAESRVETRPQAAATTPRPGNGAAPPLDRLVPAASAAGEPVPPFTPCETAEIGWQVAEALAYAHARGVLHRDIKPANLLREANGTVWVADFGLAKALADDDVSRTGDLLGTLAYMAPEQFQGRSEPRSDVYSLGLTLYELIAGRPAFDGGARKRLLPAGEGLSPVSLRRVAPLAPRDLATIIDKAVAGDPEQRYASAEALAADLRAYLDDRPIAARRAPLWEQTWRWARRNPLVAGLSAAVAGLLLLVAAVLAAGYVGAQRSLARETAARTAAEASADLAAAALDDIFHGFAGQTPGEGDDSEDLEASASPPALSAETATLLQELLAYYDCLGQQQAGEPRLWRRAAQARRFVGDIRLHLGQFEEAIAAYTAALDQYRELAPIAEEAKLEDRLALARVHNGIGAAHLFQNRDAASQAEHGRALALLHSAPAEEATARGLRFEEARTRFLLARRILPGMGPQALPEARGPRPAPGEPPHAGEPSPRMGRTPSPEAEEHLRKAVEILSQLSAEVPRQPAYRAWLAACYREQAGDVFAAPHSESAAADREARRLLEELVRDHPEEPRYRHELVRSLSDFDVLGPGLRPEDAAAAADRLRQAVGHAEKLVAAQPHVPDFLASLVHARFKLGRVLELDAERSSGQARADGLREAEQQYRLAISGQAELAQRFPAATAYPFWLALMRERLGTLLYSAGRLVEAHDLLQSSIGALLVQVDDERTSPALKRQLATAYETLASVLDRQGQSAAAEQAEKSATHWETASGASAESAPFGFDGFRPPFSPPPWLGPRHGGPHGGGPRGGGPRGGPRGGGG